MLLPMPSASQTSVVEVTENFNEQSINDLTDWTFQEYAIQSDVLSPITHEFSLQNGRLQNPNQTAFGDKFARAIHNSTAAYGTWSFEWTPSSISPTYDAVEILKDYAPDPYNLTNRTFPQTDYFAGYSITLSTTSPDSLVDLYLVKFQNTTYPTSPIGLSTTTFQLNQSSSHNIEITRLSNGQFKISVDSVQQIQFTDNTWTTAEVFNFVAFQGNSSFDNLVIEKSVITTTSSSVTTSSNQSTPISPVFVVLGIITISYLTLIKRKRY